MNKSRMPFSPFLVSLILKVLASSTKAGNLKSYNNEKGRSKTILCIDIYHDDVCQQPCKTHTHNSRTSEWI